MVRTNVMVGGKIVYANANTCNVKLTSKGPAMSVGKLFGGLSKSEARRVRKNMAREGLTGLAAVRRVA